MQQTQQENPSGIKEFRPAHEENQSGQEPLSNTEIVNKLVKEIETLLSRDRLQENNWLMDRLSPDLELPFQVLARENKVRAITEDLGLIKEAISKCPILTLKPGTEQQKGDVVRVKVPSKIIYCFNNITTLEKPHFEEFLKECPVYSKIIGTDMNDKHGLFKVVFENREVGEEFFKWLDQKKKYKDKPINFRYENEEVYKSMMEFNLARRGPARGPGYGNNFGDNQMYNYYNYMMNYGNYMQGGGGKGMQPNFYVRRNDEYSNEGGRSQEQLGER